MTMYISKNTFNQEQSTLTTDQNDKITALFSAYPFLVTILAVVILANRLVAACACEIKKLLKHITEVSDPDQQTIYTRVNGCNGLLIYLKKTRV